MKPNIPYDEKLQAKLLLQSYLVAHSKTDVKKLKYYAQSIIEYAYSLENIYKRETSPLMHNFLVNSGLKERGLCWHFSYDMRDFINTLKIEDIDIYIVGANIDDYWLEHNSVVLTCKGCSYQKGVIIDPWRQRNTVFVAPISEDTKYRWSQRGGLQND